MMLLTTETMHTNERTNKQQKETNKRDKPNEVGGKDKPFLHYKENQGGEYRSRIKDRVMVKKRFTSTRYPQALAAASIV